MNAFGAFVLLHVCVSFSFRLFTFLVCQINTEKTIDKIVCEYEILIDPTSFCQLVGNAVVNSVRSRAMQATFAL